MSDNRGKCYGLSCNCEDFIIVNRIAGDLTCDCGHSELCHFYKSNGYNTKSSQPPASEAPKAYSEPAEWETPSKPANPSKVPSSPSGATLTPKEARAILRRHGLPVGERGRIHPNDMAKAIKLKESE